MVDFTIEDNCYVNDKFIGTTVAKKITVNIINTDNEIDLENKEVQAFVGVNDEYVPFGNFIIEKPTNEEVKEKTNFVGYDYMIKFNVPYQDRVTYPISLINLLTDLCNQVGLQLGNQSFVNSSYMVQGNPFNNGEDCRTVLSNIAQLAGGFAKIGRDNKVYIVSLSNMSQLLTVKDVDEMTVNEMNLTLVRVLSNGESETQESIDGNNYFADFSKNKQWGELNSLVIKDSNVEDENVAREDSQSILDYGKTEIDIEDNYFLTTETERQNVITALWNSLKGLKYLPFVTEYYGYPYLDAGDLIYIRDIKDNGYISYVLNHTFTYNGSFSGKIETPAITKSQTAYKNTSDISKRLRQAEVKVDKINGEIELLVGEDEIISKINLSPEQIKILSSKLGISASDVLDILAGNAINLTSKNITITSNNFSVDANGNLTCSNANVSGTISSNNATITGGSINIESNNNEVLKAYNTSTGTEVSISGNGMMIHKVNSSDLIDLYIMPDKISFRNRNDIAEITADTISLTNRNNDLTEITAKDIKINGNSPILLNGQTDVNDLNNLTETGIYYVGGTSVSNAPSGFSTWYMVKVIELSPTFYHQYAYKPSSGKFAMREHSGSPATWGNWAIFNKDV